MESSEKILNNYDVLQLIFRYLDFKDHLKLIKICPQFEDAIVHGVWRLMYKNLHILETVGGNFDLCYNAENNVMVDCLLTPEELHIILHHSSIYIHKLELISIRCLENIMSFNYHHLTELTLRGTVEDAHLQQVAENCLNLQSITLTCFSSSKKESNIRANVFGKMKALNKLKIYDPTFCAWNYFDVQQLFCLPHLKTLIIDINIGDSDDNKGKNNDYIDRIYNIENLAIGELPYLQSWSIRLIQDLIRLENLTKLSITLPQSPSFYLRDNVLTQINNGCPKLCELSFTDCYFKFKEFPRMNNLMHLTFELFEDIRLKNFDEIFRKLKLKSLSLVSVEMGDESENISSYNYISNTLETLDIRNIFDFSIVRTFFDGKHKFKNVSKVRILDNDYRGTGLTKLCFSHNFPNLQELIMDSYYISSEDILHLEHLKVLQFDLFENMTWSYLKILFQHPTLTHITITLFDCQDFEMHYEHLPECCEGLTTTLEYLSLPSIVYERALNFWPSFQQRNKLLKLKIVDRKTSRNQN